MSTLNSEQIKYVQFCESPSTEITFKQHDMNTWEIRKGNAIYGFMVELNEQVNVCVINKDKFNAYQHKAFDDLDTAQKAVLSLEFPHN